MPTFQYVNAKATFTKLDWCVLNRLFLWARKKHGCPSWRSINAKYKQRDPKGHINFVTHLADDSLIWLYRMTDRPIRRYQVNWQTSSYLNGSFETSLADDPDPVIQPVSYPAKEQAQNKLIALRRDGSTYQQCYRPDQTVHVHHLIPRHLGGFDHLDNLITLCVACHHQTQRSLSLDEPS